MSSQPLSDMKWTTAVLSALKMALEDPEVSEAIKEIGTGQLKVALHLVSGQEDRYVAFGRIRMHCLATLARRRADQCDLGPTHFTDEDRRILSLNPRGRELRERMRIGDSEAVAPATALLAEIREERRPLGVCAIEDSTGCVVVAGSEAIAPSDGQVI